MTALVVDSTTIVAQIAKGLAPVGLLGAAFLGFKYLIRVYQGISDSSKLHEGHDDWNTPPDSSDQEVIGKWRTNYRGD